MLSKSILKMNKLLSTQMNPTKAEGQAIAGDFDLDSNLTMNGKFCEANNTSRISRVLLEEKSRISLPNYLGTIPVSERPLNEIIILDATRDRGTNSQLGLPTRFLLTANILPFSSFVLLI